MKYAEWICNPFQKSAKSMSLHSVWQSNGQQTETTLIARSGSPYKVNVLLIIYSPSAISLLATDVYSADF